MKKFIILIVSFFIVIFNSFSQAEYELEEMFLDADSWFFYEDYQEALPLFLKVLDADSLNYNVMYKIGFCYLHIPGQKHKAIPYLENAIKRTTFSYRNNIYSEKSAPIDALFYLGNAYLVNNQIDEAIDAYTGFQNKITRTKKVANKDIYDLQYLNRQFDACRNALQFKYDPINFIAENIGSPINTRFNEFNAIVSGDGNSLVFTASLQFYDAIFYSKKQNGAWSYPMNIMGQLGVDDKSATTGISFDGSELYIYRDDDFDGNIYVSFLQEDGMWSKVKKLGDNINTKYWESHASPSPDNQKLYFVSNREDMGFGDLDIYFADRINDTTWNDPVNLGEVINTQWNENTPFLTPDGKRLFFSSEGHTGMGGYDIFYSTLINGEWSEPVNIGYPINTTDDDIFFAPAKDGTFAYCSQFSKQGYGGQDIYEFQLFHLPEYDNLRIEGVLTMDNKEDRNRENFSINIINKKTLDTIAVLNPDTDNENYQYRTPLGKNHLVYESLMDEESGNQYFISKEYAIREEFLAEKVNEQVEAKDTLPEILLENDHYLAETDKENVKIKLSLQKGGKLIVNTFYKDKLINTEEFDINKEDFIYEYKPLAGESKISFKLIDKHNNVKTEEVSVSYIPKDLTAELSIEEQEITLLQDGSKNVKIKLLVEKGSKLFVETYIDNQLINTEEFKVRKEDFVYEFEPKGDKTKLNFKLVDKHNNITNEEVIISHTPINQEFTNAVNGINSFESKKLQELFKSNDFNSVSSSASLIDLIYAKATAAGLSKQQIQALIIALAISPDNVSAGEFINKLINLSEGDLNLVLKSMKESEKDYESKLQVIDYLVQNIGSNNYTYTEIIELLEKYITTSGQSTQDLLAKINTILEIDIAATLKNLTNADKLVTLEDFRNYLANNKYYSEEELALIYALIDGLTISSNAAKEQLSTNDATSLASKDQDIDKKSKNGWMILYISIAGVLFGMIFIFISRRKNKGNKR